MSDQIPKDGKQINKKSVIKIISISLIVVFQLVMILIAGLTGNKELGSQITNNFIWFLTSCIIIGFM